MRDRLLKQRDSPPEVRWPSSATTGAAFENGGFDDVSRYARASADAAAAAAAAEADNVDSLRSPFTRCGLHLTLIILLCDVRDEYRVVS